MCKITKATFNSCFPNKRGAAQHNGIGRSRTTKRLPPSTRTICISPALALLLERAATQAIPLSPRLLFQAHASKVEPLYLALQKKHQRALKPSTGARSSGRTCERRRMFTYIRVVARDHLTVADLVAEAVCRFIRIDRQF